LSIVQPPHRSTVRVYDNGPFYAAWEILGSVLPLEPELPSVRIVLNGVLVGDFRQTTALLHGATAGPNNLTIAIGKASSFVLFWAESAGKKPTIRGYPEPFPTPPGESQGVADWSDPWSRLEQLYALYAEDLIRVREELRSLRDAHFQPRTEYQDWRQLRTHMFDPEMEIMYLRLRDFRPRHVLELGSFAGWSTCLILLALRDNGHGQLYSFDMFPDAGFVSQLELAEGTCVFRCAPQRCRALDVSSSRHIPSVACQRHRPTTSL